MILAQICIGTMRSKHSVAIIMMMTIIIVIIIIDLVRSRHDRLHVVAVFGLRLALPPQERQQRSWMARGLRLVSQPSVRRRGGRRVAGHLRQGVAC